MVRSKKLLLAIAIACACGTAAQAAEIQWTATSGTVPSDGNTYYVNTTINLTGNLTNNGTLEIRDGGTIVTDTVGPPPVVHLYNNGTLNISGGSLQGVTNGKDSAGTININSGVLLCATTTGIINTADSSNANSTINIYGGELLITGGTLSNGYDSPPYNGIINLMGGNINMTGGTFKQSAKASGGKGIINISSGTFHMSGGTFQQGSASTYPDVNVSGGRFKLSDGTFRNGEGLSANGSVTVTGGTLELAGGTFTNGYSASATGNLTVTAPGTFILGGATLVDGAGTSNISIFGNDVIALNGQIGNTVIFTIPAYGTFVIGYNSRFENYGGATLNINENAKFKVSGVLNNYSATSVNVNGNLYIYNLLQNGTSIPGTININNNGRMYLLGGTLQNGHASSAINVNSGGQLNSYHGTVDAALGTLTIAAGGSFDNVRGNNPGAYLSLSAGSNFVEDEVVYLKDTLEIDYAWTITNKSTIDADGNTIIFGPDGEIFVRGADASLLIKDAIIKDVSGNQIRCSDDTTTLSIDNVTWIQDANYSFSKGTLSVNGDWAIQGRDTTFTFSSDQTLTIQQNASLIFDNATSFSYDSPTATNLVMADADAILRFKDATLSVQDNLRLTKGVAFFDDTVTFNVATGKTLYFGDNSSSSNNLTFEFAQDSEWGVTGAGTVSNQNV